MKEQKIKELTEKVGATRAPKFWGLFVERLCEGIEPEAGDTFKREDIERAFANNPTARDALIAIFCSPQKETPKPTTLKEKHRETLGTDVLLAEHLKGSAPAWITAELVERSKGQGCLFTKDGGGIYEIESIQWIEWLRAGAPMAEGREIEGKFRRPVRIGQEKPLATFPRDPFPGNARGAAPLKMPGFVSGCGASFESADKPGTLGVTSEALSFLILVSTLEVPSVREQREACETAKKGLEELRAAFPLAKQAWDEGQRPESTVPAVPFAEPPATMTAPRGGDVAPTGSVRSGQRIYVAGADEAGPMWAALRTALAPLERQGLKIADRCPPGESVTNWAARQATEADLVLALITPGFVATRQFVEIDALAERVAKVVPVLLRKADLSGTTLGRRRTLPRDPVASLSDKDDAYSEIAGEIRRILAQMAPARPTWGPDMLRRAQSAIITAGLADSRNTLLGGIAPHIVAGLPRASNASAQVFQDLNNLPTSTLDGSNPLRAYLETAAHLATTKQEAAVLREAIAALG